MGIRNIYEKGYYVEDGYGDLTRVDNPNFATHYYDGYTMNRITTSHDDDVNMFSRWKEDDNDDVSLFSHWKD